MNSKLLTILTLIIAIVALVVGVVALNKAGVQADVRESIDLFKSEIETVINDLGEIKTEIAAQAGNKLELVEAQIEEASDYAQLLVSFFGGDQDDVLRILDNLGDTHLEYMLSSGMSLALEEGISEYEFVTRSWIFEAALSEYIATKVVDTLE